MRVRKKVPDYRPRESETRVVPMKKLGVKSAELIKPRQKQKPGSIPSASFKSAGAKPLV